MAKTHTEVPKIRQLKLIDQPTLDYMTRSSGPLSDGVTTLHGYNFVDADTTEVDWGGTTISYDELVIDEVNDTISLTVTTAQTEGDVLVKVKVAAGYFAPLDEDGKPNDDPGDLWTTALTYTYVNRPTLTGIDPAQGYIDKANTLVVIFDEQSVAIESITDTKITVYAPESAEAKTVDVLVNHVGGPSEVKAFTYVLPAPELVAPAPMQVSTSPPSGPGPSRSNPFSTASARTIEPGAAARNYG